MKFYIETFGCQMNENDTERIQYLLESSGYKKTDEIEASTLLYLIPVLLEKAQKTGNMDI